MKLEAGTQLGPYEILELRGKGGMGEVYRARDTRLDRDVAVKVLPAELTDDETYRKRLEREAKTISQLQHNHICTLHDIGSEGNLQYLVMEYLEGETLEDRLQHRDLEIDEVLRIGTEIAEAVDAAHKKGVVHRDLKPGNVMLTEGGVKVLDFGLAREFMADGEAVDTQAATVPAITSEGQLVGTMPYMAPEQLQGEAADSRTDIWALGCILYEMATGARPFSGGNQASLIGAILKDEPEPPSSKKPLTPERLDHIVRRCLEKSPERRWQSGRDIAIELAGVVEDAPRVVTGVESSPIIRVAAFLGAAVLVAAGVFFMRGRPDRGEEPAPLPSAAVAVLPFDNLSGDAELDQVALGIPEEVLDRLEWLTIPRATSFSHSGKAPCTAAQEMNAGFVVEGSVRRSGDLIRVTARLHQCPSGTQLFSEPFDHPLGEGFAAQEELAQQIVAATYSAVQQAFRTMPGGAMWRLGQRTKSDNAKALEDFLAGEREDPEDNTNPLWVVMALNQALSNGWADDNAQAIIAMEAAADRCLAVAPQSHFCHLAAGFAHQVGGRGEQRIAAFERALALSGPLAGSYRRAAWAYAEAGNHDKALEYLETSRRLRLDDPGEPTRVADEARVRFAQARYDEAVRLARESAQTSVVGPYNLRGVAYELLAASAARSGDLDLAHEALGEALELNKSLSIELVGIQLAAASPDYRQRYLDGLRMAGLGAEGEVDVAATLSAEPPTGQRKLVVLPFDTFTDDPDLDQMALGIADNLIVRQTGVWPVVPRSAAFAAEATDSCSAASGLQVGLELSGSVQKLDEQLRVSAQLTACPEGDVLWDRVFDYESTSGFSLQDEIGGEIFATLQRPLWISPGTGTGGLGDQSWHFRQMTREDNELALALNLEYLEIAPQEKLHWFNAVMTHLQAQANGWSRRDSGTVAELDRLVKGCFAADPRGWVCHVIDALTCEDPQRAERCLAAWTQAVESSGTQANILGQYGRALALFGRPDEAVQVVGEAMALSPGDEWTFNFHYYLAVAHFVAERYGEAVAEARRSTDYNVRDLWAGQGRAWELRAAAEAQLGNLDEAREALAVARIQIPELSTQWVGDEWIDPEPRRRFLDGLRMAGLDE